MPSTLMMQERERLTRMRARAKDPVRIAYLEERAARLAVQEQLGGGAYNRALSAYRRAHDLRRAEAIGIEPLRTWLATQPDSVLLAQRNLGHGALARIRAWAGPGPLEGAVWVPLPLVRAAVTRLLATGAWRDEQLAADFEAILIAAGDRVVPRGPGPYAEPNPAYHPGAALTLETTDD